jgi:hypothetical protein
MARPLIVISTRIRAENVQGSVGVAASLSDLHFRQSLISEADDAVMTRLDEPPTVKKITDQLCGVAVVLVTARVAAKNRIARFGPLARDPAVPLRLHPILVIRDDGQQTAMLTGGTGFDLVYDVKFHGARLCPDVHPCRSMKSAPLLGVA